MDNPTPADGSQLRAVRRLFYCPRMTTAIENPVKYRAPERYQTHDEEDFEVFPDVPVFKESERNEGEPYGKPELELLAAGCNRRITNTGDYSPIVVGHTPDPDDPNGHQPPVIGFAGPFKIGIVGEDDPKWAILADFRVFSKDVDTFRANPRRSVEVWPADKPEDRYIDPIAVLGAETPCLDLGLVYSRGRHQSETPDRYEMSTPGGTNTFIPTTDSGKKKKPDKNNKEQNMFSPEDIAQLIEALKSTFQVRGEEAPAMPAVDEPPAVEGVADMGYDPDKMGHMGTKFGKYAKDDGDDMDGALKYMETMDDEEKEHFHKYMADSEDGGHKDMYNKLSDYMDAESYSAGSGYKCPDDDGDGMTDKYRKERTESREKYRKVCIERDSLKEKNSTLEESNAMHAKAEKYAKREAALTDLSMQGYCFTSVADELAETDDYSDEQFKRHTEKTIPEKYSRVPGGVAPVPDSPERLKPDVNAEKYSAAAMDACSEIQKKNPSAKIVYRDVLENVTKNEGKYVAA